jgi:NAD(P)-dependent dehydrogenase (short-subunit alcohol dehydrogenase family)
MELADYNIRVNAVSPAVVNTTLYHGVLAEKKQPKRHLKDLMAHPIGKIGSAEEVANAVVFLLSDKSSWTTGILDDGGVMAGRN